jgi:tetratricopeptide (TPR) repeat protein
MNDNILNYELQIEFNSAMSLYKDRMFQNSQEKFEYILQYSPNHSDTLAMLGVIQSFSKNYKLAIQLTTRAIKSNPRNEKLYNTRGYYNISIGKFNEGIVDYKKAIKLNQNYTEAYNNYAMALKDTMQWENALNIINKAININNKISILHVTKGKILLDLQLLGLSIKSLDTALQINSKDYNALYTKSLSLIMNKQISDGWQLYEHRWKTNAVNSSFLKTDKPLWNGSNAYKNILVWKEQGIGDEIMCSSLINDLAKHCNRIYLLVDIRLITLYKRSFSSNVILIDPREPLDDLEYDAHIPIFSLPLHFKLDPNNYIDGKKFLYANKLTTDKMKKKIQNENHKKICGISWKSGSNTDGNARTIDLLKFIKLLDNGNLIFVNLQYGETAAEIDLVEKKLGIKIFNKDLVDNKNDIDGLASIIEACDVVVSIDSATVHLAGALGKDTHVILPFKSDFRWMADVNKSIWYNSITLYRQKRDLRWDNMLKEIKHNIQ